MSEHTRALVAEACGSFWFFVIGAGAIVTDMATNGQVGLVGVALAHGLALSIAISSFGALSGGHFNPAVTLGLAVAKKHPWGRVPTYWGAQLVGGIAAGLVLRVMFDYAPAAAEATHLGTPGLGSAVPPLTAVIVETVLTLFLLWAVFGTAVSPNAPRIAGFGIGLAVAADILIGGPITGAAMNPARWLGPAVASAHFANALVYIVGPLLGGAIAGLSYLYVFGAAQEREPIDLPPATTPAGPPGDRRRPA